MGMYRAIDFFPAFFSRLASNYLPYQVHGVLQKTDSLQKLGLSAAISTPAMFSPRGRSLG